MPQWTRLAWAWCVVVAATTPSWGYAQNKPIYTNKPRFRIPYNFEAEEMQRLGAREIRLYVSLDQGLRWLPTQTVAPQPGKFSFQAQTDGEYWFCVRTLDGRGKLHPADDAVTPGLQVVVDTSAPKLHLSLRQISPGRIRLNWAAQDDHLDPGKLRLEYIQPGMTHWLPVSVVPKAQDQTEWNVAQPGLVAVRGSIADLAGNVGQHETRLQFGGANGRSSPSVPDFRDPVAGNDVPQDTTQPRAQAQNPGRRTTSSSPRITPRGEDSPWPSDEFTSPTKPAGPASGFVSHQPGANPSLIRQDMTRAEAGQNGFGQPMAPPPPRDPQLRIVNQRQFQIGYRVDEVGPSGIGGVELFITQDQGQSWFRYGEDPDHQSPFVVSVPKAGLYGFTMTVRSGVGIAADPPQPGERPAFQVLIDESAPQVQMMAPEQGRGSNLNKVLLRWMTQDDQLAERPVSLWYAATPQGPWQPLAMGLENTGSYVWTMSPGIPMRLHFRIEVRDAAGNVQTLDTAEPMLIDLARPTARILDIEATGMNR